MSKLDNNDPDHNALVARVMAAAVGVLLEDDEGLVVHTITGEQFLVYVDNNMVNIQREVPTNAKHGERFWMSDHPQQ